MMMNVRESERKKEKTEPAAVVAAEECIAKILFDKQV